MNSTVVGQPQPLPPELATVAYRVLQEMLTNALKHGRRGDPVHVEQHWEGELRLEVANVCADLSETQPIARRVPTRAPLTRAGRVSTACVVASSPSVVDSTYAVARRRLERRTPRRRGYPYAPLLEEIA